MKRQYTPRQYAEAVERNGGNRQAAAKELGVLVRTVYANLEVLRKRGEPVPAPSARGDRLGAMRAQVEASHLAAPEPYEVRGVSTLRDRNGEVVLEWVKTGINEDRRQEMIRAAAGELAKSIPPAEPLPAPASSLPRLLNLYVFTDYHMGMLAWHKEGGADWDLEIAERTLIGCFEAMLASAPAARVGYLCQLGDFLHTDGLVPVTPTGKHVLDADSRFPKIVAVTIRALRRVVDRMLERHEEVVVLMEEGNHDPSGSVWLRALFAALYDREPRVRVEDSPLPYHVHRHGKTMLVFHHGHLRKPDRLAGVMAAQFPVVWGGTTHRYCHTGHLHHAYEKEDAGMTVVQHPTLAARDAYAARGGYHGARAARCISYDEEHGEVGRTVVTPEMVL